MKYSRLKVVRLQQPTHLQRVAILVMCSVASVCAANAALGNGDIVGQAAERLYEGESLAVWEKRAKDTDPKSLHAATLVVPLVAIVEDQSVPDAVRGRLAVTLGRIGKPAAPAVPALAAILGSPTEPLANRIWAGRALGLMGESASPATAELIAFLFDERIPFGLRAIPVEALAMIGSRHPDVLPALVELFQYAPPANSNLTAGEATLLRELAAEAFALLGPEADVAVPLLIRAVRDAREAELIRRASLIALGQIGTSAGVAVPAIMESLEFDSSEAARDEAARALARIGGDGHTVLQHYFSHPEASVRWRVSAAITDIKSPNPGLMVALRKATADPSEVVRLAAVESLGRLGKERDVLVTVALRLLASESRQTRMRAMRLVLSHQPLTGSEIACIKEMAKHHNREIARMATLTFQKLNVESTE